MHVDVQHTQRQGLDLACHTWHRYLVTFSSLMVLVPYSAFCTRTLLCSPCYVFSFSFLPVLPWPPNQGFFTNITVLILILWPLGAVATPDCPGKWWCEVPILWEWSLENSDLVVSSEGGRGELELCFCGTVSCTAQGGESLLGRQRGENEWRRGV